MKQFREEALWPHCLALIFGGPFLTSYVMLNNASSGFDFVPWKIARGNSTCSATSTGALAPLRAEIKRGGKTVSERKRFIKARAWCAKGAHTQKENGGGSLRFVGTAYPWALRGQGHPASSGASPTQAEAVSFWRMRRVTTCFFMSSMLH